MLGFFNKKEDLKEDVNFKEGIIPIILGDKEERLVNARDIHRYIEIKDSYADWIKRIISYGFADNVDYTIYTSKAIESKGNKVSFTSHLCSIDMAKSICIIEGDKDKSDAAKKYFNRVATAWTDRVTKETKISSKQLDIYTKYAEKLESKIAIYKPKADYTDATQPGHGEIMIGQAAKILTQHCGYNIGPNTFFAYLRNEGYLINRKGLTWNNPQQKYVTNGMLTYRTVEIEIEADESKTKYLKPVRVTFMTAKGLEYFIGRIKKGKLITGGED